MAGLDDIIRSSVPGGNIGKPLLLSLLALLASGALFGGSAADSSASTGAQPKSDQGAGGLLAGLGGLLSKLVGSAMRPIPGLVWPKSACISPWPRHYQDTC